MKVTREQYGVRLRMPVLEADALGFVIEDVIALLNSQEADDPVLQRLYPAGYRGSATDEQAFRDLTESALKSERLDRAERCLADLATARSRRGTTEVILERDDAQRWLRVLNDARLAIGTRIGISEDDEHLDLDPEDPADRPRMTYLWLTAVQDALVDALMG